MIEYKIWNENPKQEIIGADEVGRGSFAGPIVGAAVKINIQHKNLLQNVKDSKKLSEKKRNKIYDEVLNTDIEYSISECSNKIIDEIGISKSNELVLEKSIGKIYTGNERVYVDHFKIYNYSSVSLIRGEDHSKAIALASIIAKVHRDNIMKDLSLVYPKYLFEKNKGYGTKQHRENLIKYGISDVHRNSFNLLPK